MLVVRYFLTCAPIVVWTISHFLFRLQSVLLHILLSHVDVLVGLQTTHGCNDEVQIDCGLHNM